MESNSANGPDTASVSGVAVAPSLPGPTTRQQIGGSRTTPPDNSFKLGRPALNRKTGTARLPVTVPGAGTVIVSGAGTSSRAAGGPATLIFRVAAQGRKRRVLTRSGTVVMRLTVAFIPTGGDRSAQTATIRLKKKP